MCSVCELHLYVKCMCYVCGGGTEYVNEVTQNKKEKEATFSLIGESHHVNTYRQTYIRIMWA